MNKNLNDRAYPTCFAIMAFGGGDEEVRRHSMGVYQSIIVPAATKAGFIAKRADLFSKPGNIVHDIVDELIHADIVIADLTHINFNVGYDLGIRHAFKTSGTIHIADISKARELPFDIAQYRVVGYSTNLADIPQTIEQIADAINKRVAYPDRPDNVVHDAISELPSIGSSKRTLDINDPDKVFDIQYDVFLSYSVADRETALEITQRLDEERISYFLAEKSIGPGQIWESEIKEAIRACRQFWILVTPNSLNSEWVTSEWAAAWVLEKTIVPVILRCRPDELPTRLQVYQCLDFHKIQGAIVALQQAKSS